MFEAYKRYFRFSSKYKTKWIKAVIFEIFKSLFEGLQFVALIIFLKAIIEQTASVETAAAVLALMIVSVAGSSVMWKFAHEQEGEASYRSCESSRFTIGERMKYMPMGFFNDRSLGNITAVATTTMEDLEAMSFAVIVNTLMGILHVIVLCFCTMFFEWRLGLIFLSGVFLFMAINGVLLRKSREVSPARLMAQTELVDAVLEYIQGMSVVKAFHMINNANKAINRSIQKAEQHNLKVERLRIPYIALESCILSMAAVGVVAASIFLYYSGMISLLVVSLMLIVSFIIYKPLEVAGKMFFMLPMIDASLDRVYEIEKSPLMDIDGQKQVLDSYDIQFEKVSFCYDKRKVIDDVTLHIKEGTTTAFVGPSGGGKTTLCNLIARFWDVSQGAVTLGGRNIKAFSLDSLLANISMVFQSVYLFNDTIENNIKFGKPDATHEEVITAASKACCHDFIKKLPQGYETIIGEGGANISGGERQRISIARAILKDAPIIILDEATANVDPENEEELQYAIESLTESKTVIMIAHRLKTVREADQIIVLDNGRIVQQGTHETLMTERGIYTDFCNRRNKAVSWRLGNKVTAAV